MTKIFLMIFMFYVCNVVFGQELFHYCNNPDAICRSLNDQLRPCFYSINFPGPILGPKMGFESFPFPNCVCNQEFYNDMVSCGNTCNITVDDPEEFEFDCKDFGASVNLGGGGGNSKTIPNSNTNLNPNSNSNTNLNPNSNSKSNTNTIDAHQDQDQKFHKNLISTILGGLFAIIILIAIIIMFVKRRKEQSQTLQTQPQSQTSTSFISVADPLKPAHPTHPANPTHPTNLTNSTNPTHSTNPTQPTDFPQPYNPCK